NRAEGRDDPKAQVRKVPSLLPQEGPKDGKASKSRHFPLASGGEKARTGGAVFQAPLRDRGAYIESDITAGAAGEPLTRRDWPALVEAAVDRGEASFELFRRAPVGDADVGGRGEEASGNDRDSVSLKESLREARGTLPVDEAREADRRAGRRAFET